MKTGEFVLFTDEYGQEHHALLTAVHDGGQGIPNPAVNLVYISDDVAKRDPYGQQVERRTSVVHREHQSAHGMYWDGSGWGKP